MYRCLLIGDQRSIVFTERNASLMVLKIPVKGQSQVLPPDILAHIKVYTSCGTHSLNIMALSLATKDCVTVAKTAVKEIDQGNTKDASILLDGLKIQGTKLSKRAEDLAKRLKKVQEYNQKQQEETQRKIGEYGCREQDLRNQMHRIQANLDSQRKILEDKHSCLVQA